MVDPVDVGDAGGDMGPEQAAELATEGPAEASGPSGGGFGGGGGPMSRLFDGDAPGPETTKLQGDYGVDNSLAILLRGVLRVATGSGVPPIAEIVMGAVLWFQRQADGGESSGEAATSALDAADGVRTAPES